MSGLLKLVLDFGPFLATGRSALALAESDQVGLFCLHLFFINRVGTFSTHYLAYDLHMAYKDSPKLQGFIPPILSTDDVRRHAIEAV